MQQQQDLNEQAISPPVTPDAPSRKVSDDVVVDELKDNQIEKHQQATQTEELAQTIDSLRSPAIVARSC